MTETVSACPCCGSYSVATLSRPPALLAVCDVLVVRALQAIGKRTIKNPRSRFSELNGRPFHIAHTLWETSDEQVDLALHGAWDVVPAMLDRHGCCGVTTKQVTDMLDAYVRELVYQRQEHQLADLKQRFESTLGLQVGEPEPYLT